MNRFQIVVKYKGQLPRTMKTLFRSERRARETLTLLRHTCAQICLCKLNLLEGGLSLVSTEEYEGFDK